MPRIEITGFSPRVFKEARAFFEAHPVFEMEQLREIAVEGPGGELIEVVDAHCLKCGFTITPADSQMLEQGKQWPADTLRAISVHHAWDQASRSVYCGGIVSFSTRPVPMLRAV